MSMIRYDGSVSRMVLVIAGVLAGMASAAVVATPAPGPAAAIAATA